MREEFSPWWRIGSLITLPLVRLVFDVGVEGIEHVPPTGGAILAFNHVSALDGPVLAIETAFRRRRAVRFLAAAEWFSRGVYGWILRRFQQIPIHRGKSDARALDEAVATLEAGALAALAPEGRVGRDPEAGLQRIRSGCARIALPAGTPEIPVGIWGTQRRWPKSGLTWRRPLRPRLAITYGPPLLPHVDEDVAGFTQRIGAALEAQVRRARAQA
jgi:1-acyl-sn-glycerol-3-phosphate acyltransferase